MIWGYSGVSPFLAVTVVGWGCWQRAVRGWGLLPSEWVPHYEIYAQWSRSEIHKVSLDRTFSWSAFLDCKLIECINKLKECVPSKWDESGNETQKSQFVNISSISPCRIQRRVSIPFRTTAFRPTVIKSPSAATRASCFEPSRQIMSLRHQHSKVIKKIMFF